MHEVVGVMPAGFFFPDTDVRLWRPTPCGLRTSDQRGDAVFHAVGRLKAGVSVADATRDLDRINRRLALAYPDTNNRTVAGVFPLRQIVIGEYERALWTLLAAVGLVLLMACVNVGQLYLARAADREYELAVRAATGASRGRLLRQLLMEAFVLSIVAGTVGLVLAQAILQGVNRLALVDIPRLQSARLDGRTLAFTAIVTVGTALVSGLWPAWSASRRDVSPLLTAGFQTTAGARHSRARNFFAFVQVAIALPLVVVAGLLVRSFVGLTRADWGFDADRLLLMDVRPPETVGSERQQLRDWSDAVVGRLRQLPGVTAASKSDGVPIRWTQWSPRFVVPSGSPPAAAGLAGIWVVGAGYFETAGIRQVDGLGLDRYDDSPARRVVVSRALADRLWPDRRPLGRQLDILEPDRSTGRASRRPEDMRPVSGGSWTVVGVVGNVRMFSLDFVDEPAMYIEDGDRPSDWLSPRTSMKFLLRTSGDPMAVVPSAKSAIAALAPEAEFNEIAPMRDLVDRTIGGRGSNKLLLVIAIAFGTTTFAFTILGIYGVVSWTVSTRLVEIGIRKALGAHHAHLARLILANVLRMIAAGLAVGIAVAWAASRTLGPLLFAVSATDWPTYLGASLAVVAGGVLACALPFRRAVRVDPCALLRR